MNDIEKQIPKKVIESGETHCPNCGAEILTYYKATNYCYNCGINYFMNQVLYKPCKSILKANK